MLDVHAARHVMAIKLYKKNNNKITENDYVCYCFDTCNLTSVAGGYSGSAHDARSVTFNPKCGM